MKRAFWIALIAVLLLVVAAVGLVARGACIARPSASRRGRCG